MELKTEYIRQKRKVFSDSMSDIISFMITKGATEEELSEAVKCSKTLIDYVKKYSIVGGNEQ